MKLHFALLSGTVLMVSLSTISAHAATSFGGAQYITQADAKHVHSVKGTLVLDEGKHQLSFDEESQQILQIPYSGVDAIRLENTVSRLHRPFTQRVGRDEFLTVEYHAGDEPKYALFKLNGKAYHDVLAALETQTGKQIQYRSN